MFGVSYAITGDRDTFDLDEGGLVAFFMHKGKAHGKILFGHKSTKGEYFS